MENDLKYILFAGVNGAGKSTLFWAIENGINLPRVNSDEILVKQHGDWKNEKDVITAMREAVRLQHKYLKTKISFTQETTLAGSTIINTIAKAKAIGYEVIMYYVGLENADIAVERVRQRVINGGHGISETDIIRRYDASLNNLKSAISVCNVIYIFDNTRHFLQVASIYNAVIKVRYDTDYGVHWLSKVIGDP